MLTPDYFAGGYFWQKGSDSRHNPPPPAAGPPAALGEYARPLPGTGLDRNGPSPTPSGKAVTCNVGAAQKWEGLVVGGGSDQCEGRWGGSGPLRSNREWVGDSPAFCTVARSG